MSGRYPTSYQFDKLTGKAANASQGNIAVRSNAEWLGISGMTDGALAATGVGCAVAVPVEWGDVISAIDLLAGATAEGTGTHAFAALYSGLATPALLAQSADETGAAAVAASVKHAFVLTSSVLITPQNAPGGFVYASISITAATVATAATVPVAAAVDYQWFAGGPLFLSATHGSSLAGTAAATIASPTAKAVAPIVFLR